MRRPSGGDVRLQGWIRTRRDSKGGFSFLELNDGSSQANIQIVADAKLENYEAEIRRLAAGCSVTIEGQVRQSPAKGQPTEVHAARIVVHGWCDPETYPLQKKNHSWGISAHYRPSKAARTPSEQSPGCATRSAAQSMTFSRSKDFSIFIRRSLPPAIAKGPADVQSHDARSGQTAAAGCEGNTAQKRAGVAPSSNFGSVASPL